MLTIFDVAICFFIFIFQPKKKKTPILSLSKVCNLRLKTSSKEKGSFLKTRVKGNIVNKSTTQGSRFKKKQDKFETKIQFNYEFLIDNG